MSSFKRFSCALFSALVLAAPKLAWSDDLRSVDVAVNALVNNPVDGKLYGSITSGANSGSIVPINIATATVGTPVPLGATPKQMVVSSDGKSIDVVLDIDNGNQIRRFNTLTQTAGIQYDIGQAYSKLYAEDIVALPGSPGSVIVSRSNAGISARLQDVVIYDNGVYRAGQSIAGGVNVIEVNETGTKLYGYLSELSSFDFDSFDIGPGGFSNNVISHPFGGFNGDFKYGGGKGFSSGGAVFNPDSGAILGSYTCPGLDLTLPDASSNRLYTASQSGSNLTIKAQSLSTLADLGSITVPNVSGGAGRLLRWGSRGLAFRTDTKVYLLQSALVDGALPTLTSISPSEGQWGTKVIITGRDLLSTSSVKFNGLAATFKIDSDTQITATVPTDATTGPITVTNVGGSADTASFTVKTYVPPTVGVGDASKGEGDSGTSFLAIPITLSAPAGLPVTVQVATSGGTATTGTDYTAISTTVNIPVGESGATVNVPVQGDTTQEAHENFVVTLSNPTNATLGNSQALGTILNDDFPTISVADSSVTETDSGTVSLDFTVSLSYASNSPVSFAYKTVDGTATAGSDYVAQNTVATIPAGETSKVISVVVNADNLDEANETLYLQLSSVIGAVPTASLPRNPTTGHFYELVNANLNWNDAKLAAQARTYLGVAGHLATITTANEQAFISSNFPGVTYWLGGVQTPGSTEPSGGFTWVTGEPFSYSAWNAGEPNNANGGEDVITQNNFNQWNDVARTEVESRYLVEYDVTPGAPGSVGQATGTIINDDTNIPPVNISLTPSVTTSAVGVPKSFTAVYSDADGATNIRNAYILVRESTGSTNALFASYDAVGNKLYLQNDTNTASLGGFTPGSNNVITNNQGTLNCAATTVSRSGNELTINWNFTPSSSYIGLKNVYLLVKDAGGLTDGLDDLGDWSIKGATNTAPVNTSLSPTTLVSNVGTAKVFTAVYTDVDGVADIKQAYILVRSTLGGANALFGYYDAVANKLYLQNDANSAALGGFAPGSDNVIYNAQGSLNCANTTISKVGNTLTVNWSLTPAASFDGFKNVYLYVKDAANAIDGFDDLGDWLIKGTSNAAPVNVSVTPAVTSSNALTPKSFTAVYSDTDSNLDLKQVYLLVRGTLGSTNALFAYYDVTNNRLYMQNDGNSITLGGFTPGSNNVITNSQGTLNCANTTVSRSGNTVTVNWNFTPSSVFTGLKNVYLYSRDTSGASDGFDDLGDWTINTSSGALTTTKPSGAAG